MKTLRPRNSGNAAPRFAPAADSASSLVLAVGKNRAKDTFAAVPYTAGGEELQPHEQAVVEAAFAILWARLRQPGGYVTSPSMARSVALLRLAGREQECFAVMFLSAQHAVLAFDELFRGTLTQTSVYPREVVRAALRHNAAAVIFAHNHPSGVVQPSEADKTLTRQLREALALVDVKALDHLVIAGDQVFSFAEQGLM